MYNTTTGNIDHRIDKPIAGARDTPRTRFRLIGKTIHDITLSHTYFQYKQPPRPNLITTIYAPPHHGRLSSSYNVTGMTKLSKQLPSDNCAHEICWDIICERASNT